MKTFERPKSLQEVAECSETEEQFGRNLFVDFHLPPIQPRRGRPRKSAEHKREMNRRRVARHRAKARQQSSASDRM